MFCLLCFILSINRGKSYDQEKKKVRVALQRTAINLLQNLISSGAVTSQSYSLYLSFTQCCFVLTRNNCFLQLFLKTISETVFSSKFLLYFDFFRFYSCPYIFLYFANLKKDKSCQKSKPPKSYFALLKQIQKDTINIFCGVWIVFKAIFLKESFKRGESR